MWGGEELTEAEVTEASAALAPEQQAQPETDADAVVAVQETTGASMEQELRGQLSQAASVEQGLRDELAAVMHQLQTMEAPTVEQQIVVITLAWQQLWFSRIKIPLRVAFCVLS